MPYQYLRTRRDGPVEHLTLDRPDVRNAFNDILIAELMEWAAGVPDAATRHGLRVAVIAGAGAVFSAGADAAWMARMAGYSEAENLRDAMTVARMFATLEQLPIPLIGRVHGAALGGGSGLAAVCDIVVADDRTVFGFTEVKLGIVPAVISPFVLAKIGSAAARELFLTGARFDAARAKQIGLVHAVVPASEMDATVDGYVRELLTGGREAIAAAKALIARVSRLSPADALPLTASAIAERRASEEGREGLKAFLEKRPPSWATDGR
jgi:methylglutaconyl-CoA hydratase